MGVVVGWGWETDVVVMDTGREAGGTVVMDGAVDEGNVDCGRASTGTNQQHTAAIKRTWQWA